MENRGPFSNQSTSKSLFAPNLYLVPSWRQQMDLLGHLCLHSQNVLVLLAEKDAGKSSFAKLFHETKLPSLKKIQLQGKTLHSIDKLMKSIADGFHLPWPISGELTAKVVHYGTEDEGVLTKVIMVDDADALSDEVLSALLRLVNFTMPPEEQIHLVLMGDYPFEDRLREPEYEIIMKDNLHCMELSAWKPEDVEYLLNEKGVRQPHGLVEALMQKTMGNPKQVMKKLSMMPDMKALQKLNILNLPYVQYVAERPIIMGVSLGAILGMTLLLFSFNNDQEMTGDNPSNVAQIDEPLVLPEPDKSSEVPMHPAFDVAHEHEEAQQNIAQNSQGNAPNASYDLDSLKEVPKETMTEAPAYSEANEVSSLAKADAIQSVAAAPKVEATPKVDAPKATTETSPKVAALTNSTQVAKPAKNKAKTAKAQPKAKLQAVAKAKPQVKAKTKAQAKAQPAKATPKVAVKAHANAEVAFTPSKLQYDEQFILNQDGKHYTLQLVGSAESSNIKRFIEKNNLKDDTQVARYNAKGQDWYAVVYGTYPTLQEAKKAAAMMPGLKPWVRPYEGLQAQIKDRRNAEQG